MASSIKHGKEKTFSYTRLTQVCIRDPPEVKVTSSSSMYSVVLNACTCPVCSAVDPLKEWTKVKWLGRGSFGEVLLYKNVNTGEEQAVKMVSFDPSDQKVPSHYSKTCPTVFILKLNWFTKLALKGPLLVLQIVSQGIFPLSKLPWYRLHNSQTTFCSHHDVNRV